jgi:sulfur-carrier protein
MTIRVRLFARARDLAAADEVAVELPAGATVAELRTRLGKACPALRSLLARSAIAINEEFVEEKAPVPERATAALLPPVSGGADASTKRR